MKFVTVRKHYRKGKNKVSVIRKHSRKKRAKKHAVKLRKHYNIESPVTVKTATDGPKDSLAFTDTTLDKNDMPVKHVVNMAEDKIDNAGEHHDKVLHHELAHIFAKEKEFLTTKAGKNVIDVIKQTRAYQLLQRKNDSYEMDNEEMFARAYAQFKTGKVTPADIGTGYAWTKKDFKPVAEELSKIIPKKL